MSGNTVFSHFRFIALAIVLALSVCSLAVAAAPPRSIQADFVQEKEMKIFARPLVSEGRLVFRSPDNLRWEYLKPVKSVLLMKDGAVRKLVWENGAWREDKSAGLDAMPAILAQMTGWMEGHFDDAGGQAVFTASRDGQVVRLVPKDAGMRAVIAAIELRLAADGEQVEEVDIHESADAVTRIRFHDTVIDGAIADALFTTP